MTPIESALYALLVDLREAMRRCRDANRGDLVAQLETFQPALLEMKRRCQGL